MNRGETLYSIHAISLDTTDTTPPTAYIATSDTMHLLPGTRLLPVCVSITDDRAVLYADLGYRILGMDYFLSPDSIADSLYYFSIGPLWTNGNIEIWVDASDESGNIAETETTSIVIAQIRTDFSDGYRIIDSHLLPVEGEMPGYPDSLLSVIAEYSWIELDTALGGHGIPLFPEDEDWLSSWVSLPSGMFIPYAGRDRRGFRAGVQGYITFETATIPEREIAILPLFAEFGIDSTTAIWYLADTTGGQVIVQWSNLEPSSGEGFNFQLVMSADSGYFDATASYRTIPDEYYRDFIFHRPPLIGIRNPMLSSPLLFETTQIPLVCRHPQQGSAIRFFNTEDISNTGEQPHPALLSLSTYPNPFNSTLHIKAPENAHVTVHDTKGRTVADLGSSRTWMASDDVASGVYIVRAVVGDVVIDGKAVLIR